MTDEHRFEHPQSTSAGPDLDVVPCDGLPLPVSRADELIVARIATDCFPPVVGEARAA
jgi:hypothetical protein